MERVRTGSQKLCQALGSNNVDLRCSSGRIKGAAALYLVADAASSDHDDAEHVIVGNEFIKTGNKGKKLKISRRLVGVGDGQLRHGKQLFNVNRNARQLLPFPQAEAPNTGGWQEVFMWVTKIIAEFLL